MKTLLDREDLVFSPPSPGCVLYLPGLPGAGSKIYDRSPYGNIGTITGATWKRLPSGLWCLSFDGSDDFVDFGRKSSLLITGDLSIELWLNLADYDAYYYLIGQNEAGGLRGVYDLITESPNGRLYFGRGDGTSSGYIRTTGSIGTGWVHVVATMIGTTARIYINGSEVPCTSNTIDTTIADTGENIRMGRRQDNYAPLKGKIALLRLYTRGLSAFEGLNHFSKEKYLFGVW